MQIAAYRFAIPWRGTALRGRRQAPAALRKCAGGTFLAEAVAVALGNREGGTKGEGRGDTPLLHFPQVPQR